MTNIIEQGILFGRLCELLRMTALDNFTKDSRVLSTQKGIWVYWEDELVSICKKLVPLEDLKEIQNGRISFYREDLLFPKRFNVEDILRAITDSMSRGISINPAQLEAILNKYGRSLND